MRLKQEQLFVIHRKDPNNIGDMASAPSAYLRQFPWLRSAKVIDIETDIERYRSEIPGSNVILGGGGLIGATFFQEQLELLFKLRPRLLIAWGVGHNLHDSSIIDIPEYIKEFSLVGLRDYYKNGSVHSWAPCPSAHSEVFDKPYEVEHEIVIYHQSNHPVARYGHDSYPELSNNQADISEVIKFIGSGKVVVTSSYHGAYWAILLGRRVVIANPFSSKFYGLKYEVPIVSSGDWREYVRHAKTYPGALMECRAASADFAEKVRELLEAR